MGNKIKILGKNVDDKDKQWREGCMDRGKG